MNKSIKEFEKENPTPKLIASKFFFTCACTVLGIINVSNTLGSNQVLDIGHCDNFVIFLSRILSFCRRKTISYTMKS